MSQDKSEDILQLLAVAVLADKRVFASEVEVFTKSVSRIKLSSSDTPKLSEARSLSWFDLNRGDMQAKLELPRLEFETWFFALLDRIGTHADRSAILHIMHMIFMADSEVHVSEMALMTLIRQRWDM